MGDLPVEFVVVNEKSAADNAVLMGPPSEGYAFAFRVGDLRTFSQKTDVGEIWFRDIAFGHATLIKDAVASNAAEGLKEPSPGQALSLAMKDYIFRHAADWVIGGPLFEKDFKAPAPAAERRADLDRRLQEYEDSAKAFYGGLRTPKSWFR